MKYTIVITNEKGGTGKTTITALLVEYLNFRQQKVQLVDTDPLQTAQTWVSNCQLEGRKVSQTSANYQIIDTPGSSGSSLGWIRQADFIIVPFQPHYADLKVTTDWFSTLNRELQNKIFFFPNRWQNTKEQREGIKQLMGLVKQQQAGRILPPLSNRPALYGTLLNGSKENFFTQLEDQEPTKELFQSLYNIIKYNKI